MKPCLIWPASKDRYGYGQVKIGGRLYRAHRVAMAKKIGRKLSPDEKVLHSCHHRACVEPSHLNIGTTADNNADTVARRATLARTILGVGQEPV